MSTYEHLQSYSDEFSPEVLEEVSALADWQRRIQDYPTFFDHMGIEEIKQVTFEGYNPIEILDIRPADEKPGEALVYHLPMANPLDPNMIYQAATVAKAAEPGTRLIAMGNPSGPGMGVGAMNHQNRKMVSQGNLSPVVEPLLKYLDSQGVTKADHVGYSYGAELAAEAAASGNHAVDRLVSIEPVDVVERSLPALAAAFMSTNKELNRYVKATNLPAFEQARKDSTGVVSYTVGLGRLSNIAIARALTRNRFSERLQTSLDSQYWMNATIVNGGESELAPMDAIDNALSQLQPRYYPDQAGINQLRSIELPGQKHAFPNDLYLQAAVVLEALR